MLVVQGRSGDCDARKASPTSLPKVIDLENRELRYFVAVADELHFGRAAERLRIGQPALSRAIRQLERRLGVPLLERDRRGVSLTDAGVVLRSEAQKVLDAVAAAADQTRRAARPAAVALVTKAGASHELVRSILGAAETDPTVPAIRLRLCEVGEQARLLRQGLADIEVMHRPYDDLDRFETVDLMVESQVAIVPADHRLARRDQLTLDEVSGVPDLPMARWPGVDGTYPDGPGPEVRTQSQVSQLVALGRTLLVICTSSRAWQWPEHVQVPVVDAPLVTTVLAWLPDRAAAVAPIVRAAPGLVESMGLGEGELDRRVST